MTKRQLNKLINLERARTLVIACYLATLASIASTTASDVLLGVPEGLQAVPWWTWAVMVAMLVTGLVWGAECRAMREKLLASKH